MSRRSLYVLCVLGLWPALAIAGPNTNVAKQTKKEADRAYKAGSLEAAANGYRKLMFAGYSKVSRRYRTIRRKQAQNWIAQAKAAQDRDEVVRCLQEADALDPKAPGLKSAFKRLKYSRYQGRYRSREDIAAAKQADATRGETRKAELELDGFKIVRRGVFRLYTDLDLRQGRSVISQMLTAMETHYRRYWELMQMAGLRYPTEGLDVVLCANHKTYLKLTGRTKNSAGVYFPNKGVAWFFKGDRGIDFPTLLHEMTHQLNHKVLGVLRVTAWAEEGIADYFGAGKLTRAGRRIELGLPDVDRLTAFRSMLRGEDGGVVSLRRFSTMERAELTSSYYSQAWAVVHYLMVGSPVGRLVLFDMIQASKRKQRAGGSPCLEVAELETILKPYNLNLERLEKRYIEFHRRGGRRR